MTTIFSPTRQTKWVWVHLSDKKLHELTMTVLRSPTTTWAKAEKSISLHDQHRTIDYPGLCAPGQPLCVIAGFTSSQVQWLPEGLSSVEKPDLKLTLMQQQVERITVNQARCGDVVSGAKMAN